VDWRRAEFVLAALAFLGFLALPIRITTIYSGLPAHPLFVHVPVILIPTTVVAAIVLVLRPAWLSRYGVALALASIVAMEPLCVPRCISRVGPRTSSPSTPRLPTSSPTSTSSSPPR
jgi:hypothetical protein